MESPVASELVDRLEAPIFRCESGAVIGWLFFKNRFADAYEIIGVQRQFGKKAI
jgi:hypothetical protein